MGAVAAVALHLSVFSVDAQQASAAGHASHAYSVTALQASAGDAPRVFLLRGDELRAAKQRIASGDAALRPAYDRLIVLADSALMAGPFSVVDKTRTPPSGDKHDYMSMGPYWWPDSTKANGLPYIRRDGLRNPEGTRGFDAPRNAAMVDAVETLALAYYLTGREPYAQHATLLLRTWFLDPDTRMNPNLKYGQSIPGVVEGRGIGLIDTREYGALGDYVGMIEGSPSWTADDARGMRQWMREFLGWMRTHKYGRDEHAATNNHGTWYDAQAVGIALFVGDTAFVRATAEEATTLRIAAQIKPDGSQPEELGRTQSLHYSGFNLDALTRLADLGRNVGVDLWGYRAPTGGSIRAALDYVAPYTDPAKHWPGEQIVAAEADLFLQPLLRARLAYGGDAYADALAKLPDTVVRAHRARLVYPLAFR
ncbi:MAG TPA: alginate lyase family protein [Longimicrobiaceae bacterium]|nr:alginate lyase family protein [Longimicrobiaceae bacterium]